jgi:TPR repeat protein
MSLSKDNREEVRRLEVLANAGHPMSQRLLAIYFKMGAMGSRQDFTKGLHWLRQATEQGDETACTALGDMYHQGEGVNQSYMGDMNVPPTMHFHWMV